MVEQLSQDRGPWPGPRPYREADRHRFFGRKPDRDFLLGRLVDERLVLLTAPSAIGKTSFLRASVVPELRRRRQEALERYRPHDHPAVLVVRDWAVPDLSDADSFLIAALEESIRNLNDGEDLASYEEPDRSFIIQDHDQLIAVGHDGSAYDYVVDLANATGGLILILDQFEEALQGSSQHLEQISRLFARLFHRADHVYLLLSFREEFWSALSGIGDEIGDLNKRRFRLLALPERTLREALAESAAAGNVALHGDALDELLDWMESAKRQEIQSRRSGSRSAGPRRAVRIASPNDSSVDLLKLQALLRQLYFVASRDQRGESTVEITRRTLTALRKEASQPPKLAKGADVVARALQRFIESLLPLPEGIIDATGLPQNADWGGESYRMLRRRRAAARMGPSFSSGGFKLQQEEADLLSRAWREEWEVLDLEIDEVEKAIRSADELDQSCHELFVGLLSDTSVLDSAEDTSIQPLSGIADRESWSIRGTAVDLIETSLEMLDALCEGNVLRRKSFQGQVTFELVHDGFGDAFSDWAEEARLQPLDALTATTAERGTAFRWSRLTGSVRDARWRGCWVGPDPNDPEGGKRLLIDGVTFEDCDLRGTVFEDSNFRGGGFRNCNLGGVAFWNCSFEGATAQPFFFDAIRASGISFDDNSSLLHVRFGADSRIHNMSWHRLSVAETSFDRCILNQLTLGAVMLAGRLAIQDSWVLLSDLVGLKAPDGRVTETLDICRSDFFYCRLDDSSSSALDRGDGNERFPDPKLFDDEPGLRNLPAGVDPWGQPS